jgi:hypothetical protein
MACTQADQSKSSAWFVDSGASRHFINQKDWFTEFTPIPSKDLVIFGGGEEYNIVGKGNDQISFGGKMLMFLNVHYVPGMELNLLSVSHIMRHSPLLDVNFRNRKCYIIDNNTKNIVALGVEDHVLFRLVDIGQSREHALTTKSALDICTLWHHRYGNLNFNYLS